MNKLCILQYWAICLEDELEEDKTVYQQTTFAEQQIVHICKYMYGKGRMVTGFVEKGIPSWRNSSWGL